jgi:hypothetical protein
VRGDLHGYDICDEGLGYYGGALSHEGGEQSDGETDLHRH